MRASRLALPLSLLLLSLLAGGCAGTTGGTGRLGDKSVQYEDTKAVETLSSNFSLTDFQMAAESLAQSLLKTRYVAQAAQPPRVRFHELQKQAGITEHIDTGLINDKIKKSLLESGMIRFMSDEQSMAAVNKERDFTETATRKKQVKAMVESDYIITGAIRKLSNSTASGSLRVTNYVISLELQDYQSGEILWAGEKEIRKSEKKSAIGW